MKKTTRLIILNVAFGLVFAACAETYTWTPTGGTSWGTAANWSPNGTPGAADTVVFEANASIELADAVTVAKIQLVNGARVVLTGAGMWLKSSAFSGAGTLALDGTRLTGISTASSSWDVGLTLPSTFGIEILPNATESRITADGDKKHFQIDGPLTGAGTVRIGYSGSGLGGVKLCGDNSGFQGKLIIDHAATARNRFGAAQAGGEYMSLVYEGNTGDNGSVDFGDGVLKFGSLQTSDRRLANYPWRFNNSGTNILEVGHLGKSDDRISVRVGENNATTGHLKIRKVGTGTLELWNPGHRYGTEIDNGTILVTSDKALNLYADGDITFGHDASAPGGILKYGVNQWADDGTARETPVEIVTDYSALIKNSFAPVSIDTDGKDVTFATALSDSNVGGISKYGEGTLTLSAFQTLLSPVAVSNGTLYAYVNANVTGRIDIAENATLTLYGQSKNIDSATVCGGGTIRFVQEAGKARSFRLGQNADFSGFTGTVEFTGTTELSAADGLINKSYANHLENAMLVVSGEPESPKRIFDIERQNTTLGALQVLSANAKVRMVNAPTVTFGGKAGSESVLNGQFFNDACTFVKNGSDSTLTVGPGFSAESGSSLTVNAGTFALSSGATYAGLSSAVSLTVASGVAYTGEGVFGAVDLTAHDVVVPDASTFTDKEATYPLLTATSFSGASANANALLATLNANERKGKWKLGILRNGNGTSVLCIRYFKGGFTIVIR